MSAAKKALQRAGRAGTIKNAMDLTIGTLHRIRYVRAKPNELGFTVEGGVDYVYGGLYVDTVSAAVAKAGAGGLQPGDRLLSTNNFGMLNLTKSEGAALLKQMPADFFILVLRLGKQQWKMLKGKSAGKAQMSTPGPFFKPFCRAANLPLMDGVHSTHGPIDSFSLPTMAKVALGLRLSCFGRNGVVGDTKTTGCMFITEINRSGLAAQTPGIGVGCRLLEINGHCLLSSSQIFFAHQVKECHDNHAPIKLVLQVLDPQQWHALYIALSGAKTTAAAAQSKMDLVNAQKGGSSPTKPGQKQGLSAREQQLLLGAGSAKKGIRRTPSEVQRTALMNAQRTASGGGAGAGGSTPKRTPSMKEREQLMNSQRQGLGSPSLSRPKVIDTSTLNRKGVKPTRADMEAMVAAQRAGAAPTDAPPQRSGSNQPQLSAAPPRSPSARSKPTRADMEAMVAAQRGGSKPTGPAAPSRQPSSTSIATAMAEATHDADVMEELGADFGFTNEDDDDDAGVDDEVDFGFEIGDLSFSEVVEEVGEEEDGAVDEDEDGNPFLELTEEEIEGFGDEEFADPATDSMVIAPFSEAEYTAVPQRLAPASGLPPGVANLNRYINILPTTRTRVKLQQQGTDPTSTYINANFIGSWDQRNARAYICCQAPTPTPRTVFDFWRMIWENKSKVVIMATGITEGGVQKCVRYWPTVLFNEATGAGAQTYGNFTIKVVDGFRKDGYITSKISVQRGSEPARSLRHYWFDSWPDHGVPERAEPLIKLVEAARAYAGDYMQPWVVHCSAGIGRSGTVIALDWGLHMLEQTKAVNVVGIVDKLRHFRGGMVQHANQAAFIHDCLSRYVEAHGSTVMLSVLEEDILENSITKALQFLPEEMGTHHTQVDGDQGGESEIPKWRIKQIMQVKTFNDTSMAEELEDLQELGAQSVAERKDKRAKAKGAKSDRARLEAERKMSAIMAMPDSEAGKAVQSRTGTVGGKKRGTMGTRNKKFSSIINQFQAGSGKHGSISMGKLNPKQYASLDGDFHLDSSFASTLE